MMLNLTWVPKDVGSVQRRAGFTLVELVSVMAISVMLMGLAAAGYVGYMRTSLINRAIGTVRSKIMLARQQAVTRRNPVYVVPNGAKLGIYASIGRKNDSASPHFVSDAWIPPLAVGQRIYHPGLGRTGTVSDVIHEPLTDPPTYKLEAAQGWSWNAGEACGVLVEEYDLPRGATLGYPSGAELTISPDGTVSTVPTPELELTVKEITGPLSGTITIKNISGTIVLDDQFTF